MLRLSKLSAIIGFTVVILAQSSFAAAPFLAQSNLFEAHKDGIALYRIPGIVVATNGAVLVYCEARKNSSSDWADSEVWMRRSTNGGVSFDGPKKIAHVGKRLERTAIGLVRKKGSAEDQTVNNPVAIVDRQTGAIHFIYCVNYDRCFYMRSDDNGATFSQPADIRATFDAFRPGYDSRVIAAGPGHGIQLKSGRLLAPVWLSTGDKGHSPSVTATIYSDDHGASWHPGDIALPSRPEWMNPNEAMAVELANGSVMLNVRTSALKNRRLVTISPDGTTHWSVGVLNEELVEPVCMASIVRLSLAPQSDKNRLLFSNPDNLEPAKDGDAPGSHRARKNLSVRLSYDEGRTWPVKRVLEPGRSAYSDMAVLDDGTILCFYERHDSLTLARFNLEWLTNRKDSLHAR
ncbi:MAG: nedA [Verrucomicrobiales bacterium]|nr:nedA [Verrucomicrobiales bacterium]